MRLFSSAQHRVLAAIGGLGLVAALVTAANWINVENQDRDLGAEYAAAGQMQAGAFELAANIRDEGSAVDEFVLVGDRAALARFRTTALRGTALVAAMRETAVDVPDVLLALSRVIAATDTWSRTAAEPAIAAVGPGRSAEQSVLSAALTQDRSDIDARIEELATAVFAYSAGLDIKNEVVTSGRGRTLVAAVGSTIIVALLSLWVFRLYSRSEMRKSIRRRGDWSAERLGIVASLRTLSPQATADATAQSICDALIQLPGIDIASVLERTESGVRAIAIAGDPDFPLKASDVLLESEGRVREFLARTAAGPWAQMWEVPDDPTPYQVRLGEIGIRSRAYAAIQSGPEMIGIIVVGTTDEDHARHLFEDLPALAEFASVADAILAPALIVRRERARARVRIQSCIAETAFRPVYQPVVDLGSGLTVGFEALTRFGDGSTPDEMFASARACGLGQELELSTLRGALAEARRLPPDAWVSVNVSPSLLSDAAQIRPLLTAGTRPVVLEVTEHELIADYRATRQAVEELGSRVRLAVDDAGAGVANFNHLVELRPAFVKIDIGLVRGVDTDAGRQAVVVGLVHFAVTAGCQVIAEGIESSAERAMLMELGVTLGQGFLLARPASIDSWLPPPTHDEVVSRALPDRLRPSAFLRPGALA